MGFLDGPFSPIYGCGAIILILFVFPFRYNLLLFFIMSVVITSAIEYISSLFFEKVFKIVWWSYSDKPFNIQGRICLEYSFYWGILSILVLTFIHHNIINLVNFLSRYLGFFGVIIFTIYFIVDATDTLNGLLKINRRQFNKKIARLINSFPNLKSKLNNNFIEELKFKLKVNHHT